MKEKQRIADVIEILENFAPPKLAYSWDNVGLLVGDRDQEITRILLSLDVTPKVAQYAVKNNYNLIITHHPLFLNPLKNITDPLYLSLIRNNIAVYTMHTNLDLVREGVSRALADKLGLEKLKFIEQETETFHIALYVPEEDAHRVAAAVHQAGGGVIGNYSHCLNRYPVTGQFKPIEGSAPVIGSQDQLEELTEAKLEFFVDKPLLDGVIKAIHSTHPYETPAYATYPLQQSSLNYGLGIYGDLPEAVTIKDFAHLVKERLQAPFVKLWLADQTPEKKIRKVAVCGGSGSSLISKISSKAEIFVSADFTYHKILESPIPLIDAGHFYTEYPVLETLKKLLLPMQMEIEVMSINKADIGHLSSV